MAVVSTQSKRCGLLRSIANATEKPAGSKTCYRFFGHAGRRHQTHMLPWGSSSPDLDRTRIRIGQASCLVISLRTELAPESRIPC
jgi:hypothetical protein